MIYCSSQTNQVPMFVFMGWQRHVCSFKLFCPHKNISWLAGSISISTSYALRVPGVCWTLSQPRQGDTLDNCPIYHKANGKANNRLPPNFWTEWECRKPMSQIPETVFFMLVSLALTGFHWLRIIFSVKPHNGYFTLQSVTMNES